MEQRKIEAVSFLQQLGGSGTSNLTQISCLGLKPHQCPCPGLSSHLLLVSASLWLAFWQDFLLFIPFFKS